MTGTGDGQTRFSVHLTQRLGLVPDTGSDDGAARAGSGDVWDLEELPLDERDGVGREEDATCKPGGARSSASSYGGLEEPAGRDGFCGTMASREAAPGWVDVGDPSVEFLRMGVERGRDVPRPREDPALAEAEVCVREVV